MIPMIRLTGWLEESRRVMFAGYPLASNKKAKDLFKGVAEDCFVISSCPS